MAGDARQPMAGSATRPPTAGTVPLRRNRDFMVLWSSQVVSTVGTRVTLIAFPLLMLAVTHSPAKAGVVGFAQTLPFLLLYLPAGAFIDRWDRKRTMLVWDAGRAVALGSIAITVALGWLSTAQVVVVALIEGSLFVLFDMAEGAALPQLVTGEQLPTAIAQNQAKTQGADVVGQPLGGVLFSAARLLPFLVDAVAYLVSFVALLSIRRPFQQPRARPPARLKTEIAEGLLWVWRQPFLRAAVGVIGGMNLVFNALTLVLVVRARELGASPALIGAMFAFAGMGGLLGSFVAPWVQRSFSARRVVVTLGWLWVAQTGSRVAAERPQPRRRFRGRVVCRPSIQRRCQQPRLPGDTGPAARPGAQRHAWSRGVPSRLAPWPAGSSPRRSAPRRHCSSSPASCAGSPPQPHSHAACTNSRTIAARETSRPPTEGPRRRRGLPGGIAVRFRCSGGIGCATAPTSP
jgi:MFS family permease